VHRPARILPFLAALAAVGGVFADCSAEPTSAATAGPARGPAPSWVDVRDFADCTGATDATAAIATALATAKGGTLFVPSGCKLLLATPGAGNAAVTIPAMTAIVCADHTAGFFAARRRCSSGRYADAACSSDADCSYCGAACTGATCVYDTGSSEFAPTKGASYTMLRSVANTATVNDVRDVSIEGCSIFVNGESPYPTCAGGTNDGKPCLHVCSNDAKQTCDEDADCGGGNTCLHLSDCKAATSPGVCGDPGGEPGRQSGPGMITPIDLGSVGYALSRSRVVDVWIYDHRRGDASFTLPTGGSTDALDVDNTREAYAPYPIGAGRAPNVVRTHDVAHAMSAGKTTLHVDRSVLRGVMDGIVVSGTSSIIENSVVTGMTYGIRTRGDWTAIVHDTVTTSGTGGSAIELSGFATKAAYNTITVRAAANAVDAAGMGATLLANYITAPTAGAICAYVRASHVNVESNQFAVCYYGVKMDPLTSDNLSVVGNRFVFGECTKVTCQQAGCLVVGNYIAWGTKSPCPIISFGATDTVAQPVGHPLVASNIIHTDQAGVTAIDFAAVGKRCTAGTRKYQRCTRPTTSDCPGATCGPCCLAIPHSDVVISNNAFLAAATAVDVSAMGADQTVVGLKVADNYVAAQVVDAFKFPTTAAQVTGATISGNSIEASVVSTAKPIQNWHSTMGRLAGNTGIFPTLRSIGALRHGTGNVAVTLPPGHSRNDLLLLVVQSANEVVTAPHGYTQVGPQEGTGTPAAAGATRLAIFWKGDGGDEAAPTVVDTGDHTAVVMAAFTGVAPRGDPVVWVSGGVEPTASRSMSATGGSTTIDDALILVAAAHAVDTTAAQFTTVANADLDGVAERADESTTDGNGGGIGLFTGMLGTAGSFGATTGTGAGSTAHVFATVALLPPASNRPGANVQEFVTPGTDTWTKPYGARWVTIAAIGGGGAGGAGRSASTAAGGGGGGGGAYVQKVFAADALQSAMTIVVGAGGVGGVTRSAATASTVMDGGRIIVNAGAGANGGDATTGDGGDGGSGGSVGSLTAATSGSCAGLACPGLGGQGAGAAVGATTPIAGGEADLGGGGGASGTTGTAGGTGGRSSYGGGGGGGGTVSGMGGAGGVGGGGAAGGTAHSGALASKVMTLGGSGGGGGDATATGGDGAQPGGGGGGGGNAPSSGGNGGAGAVVITTTF
jgi:hypothetical protein